MSSYKKKLVQKFTQGSLLPANPIFEQTFRGSVDRYSFIAPKISNHSGHNASILDAGCGIGVFLLAMKHLGHRHNQEFTLSELILLFKRANFSKTEGHCLKSMHFKKGWGKSKSIGTFLDDLILSTRKTVLALGIK